MLLIGPVWSLAETADTIYQNGTIITIYDAAPKAEAVAVKDGRILAVGRKGDVLRTMVAGTKVIDLDGRTMLPGFVDAHGHVMGGGLQALSANRLAPPDGQVTDIASLQQSLRDWMASNRRSVEKIRLVVGFGYDNAELAELRHPMPEDQVDSLDRLGILPSLFSMHAFHWGAWHREHAVGPELADNISRTS